MNNLITSLFRRRITRASDRKPARFISRFRRAIVLLGLAWLMMSPLEALATLFNFNVDDAATGGSVFGASKRLRGDVYTRVLGIRVLIGNFDFTTTASSFNVTGIASGDEVDWRVDISQSGYIFSPTVRTGTAGGTATVSPQFTRSSNISGRVTDHLTGGGASGVVVTATASGKPTRSDATDVNGNYTITGLGAGTYLLTPSRANVSFTPASQSVVSGPTRSGINFVLSNHAPTINNVPDQGTDEDTPILVPFTVADVDVTASTLTVTAGSSNPALVPLANIELGGGAGNRTATITPAFNASGNSTITLFVSDGELTASDTFVLTVNPVNDPPTAGPATAMRFLYSYLHVPGFGGVVPAGEITVEFWQKISTAGPQVAFSLIPNQGTNRFEARTPDADGNVYWEFGDINSGGRLNYTPPSSLVGTWQHFAFVASANGNFMRIYRNGVPVPEAQKDGMSSFAAGNYDLRVGDLFTGDLAEFRIWSIARTPSQIRQNRDVPLTGSEPGLILYYRFIEGSGPTVIDFASAAGTHPGTLFNNPMWLAHGASPDLPSVVNVDEDTQRTVFLPGFDFESPVANLTFSITATPTNGTLLGSTGSSIVYQPNLNYNGFDHFTYQVSDGQFQAAAGISIVVQDANDLPTISTIANQTTEENEILGPIPVIIGDPDNDANTLSLSALSLDPSLVNSANVVFGGSGSNRNLTITPQPGESGTVTILVTVFDGLDSTSTSFDLRVEQKPAFAIVDLGALPARPVTAAAALNDLGSAVGKASANSQGQQSRAFLFNGLENGSVMQEIGTLGGASGEAFGINNLNVVVGDALDTNGFIHAFRYNGVSVTDLGTLPGGTESHARAINDDGVVAGYARTGGGLDRAVIHGGSGLTILTNLTGNLTNFATQSRAFALNNSNQVAGAAYNSSGASRAFLYNGTNMIDLGALPGHQASVANGLNRFAQVVGTSFSSNAPSEAFLYANGTLTGLGTLPSGGNSEARSINDFGQIVGWAISSNGQQRATFLSAGRLRDLNDLIPEGTGWTLLQANSINNRGEMVGAGVFGGQPRAFLAIPANVMGKQVTRPQGAVARVPDIELLEAQPGDTPQNAFYFSNADKKLYAVRPVTARLRWPLSANLLDTNRISAISVSVWPKTPQIHVVNTPVELEPLPNFPHTFLNLLYSTTPEANVDAGTRVFTSAQPGHSVLLYLKTDGLTPNPDLHRPYFEVVHSVPWNDPQHLLDLQPWLIGDPITDDFHADHPGRNGHVFFENAFYDGAGTDRAYDRATRTGPIIPVNRDTAAENDDMVVVWYRTNQINVAWPSKPVRYTPQWSANAPQIVIASTQGSEVLDPVLYPSMRLYNQPDPTQPGFNPNEEHAFLAANPAGGGQSIFALRSDLNAVIGASEAFCLLKYRDTASDEWRLKVYQVIRENATHAFRYTGLAGRELLPPYPLSVLTLCPASHGVSGPYWEDVNGRLYARAAGLSGDLQATVVARFFYPLLPEFFYDLDRNGTPDAPVGACIPWLDRRPGGVQNQPIDVQYTLRWPETAPVLQIGESLLTPKRGLPDILNAAKMEIIFDASNPTGADLLASAVRLYDPLSERVLKVVDLGHVLEIPAAFQIPAVIAKQNVAGKEVFTALPSHISSRLRYDPLNKWFMFHGILDESFVGEPLLLPNVLTERERDRIQELDGSGNETDFDKVIEALYDLTRNPNRVDLTPKDGLPDKALRIGLAMNGANVILEPLAEAKALTAGLASAPPPTYAPGQAPNFDGVDDSINAGTAVPLVNTSFTIEFWAKHVPGGPGDEFIIGQGSAGSGLGLRIGFLADDRFIFDFGNAALITTQVFADGEWHHWACTYDSETARRTIYLDGRAVASDVTAQTYTGTGTFWIGRGFSGGFFRGMLDDVRVWNTLRGSFQVQSDRSKRLLGTETGLLRYFRFDLDSGSTVRDESATGVNAALVGGTTRVTSDAPTGIAPRFVTLAENNDASLGLPVTLKIIRVEDGPFKGDLKVLTPENVFDEKVTLRHSSDFGAEPELVEFEWYYKQDQTNFNSADLPIVDLVTGDLLDARGWLAFTAFTPLDGRGVNYVTVGDSGSSSLLSLSDNWFIMRYRGFNVGGETNWSDWIGDPASANPVRAQLVEGWVKRVIRGINPFEQRTTDFHANAASTFASMLVQAGGRYEGDVALNASGDNLNQLGLIETYATVLNRGKVLSIDGSPPVSSGAANNALLLAASRIADLYRLLGNEAFADAADPTIGFATDGAGYGSLATSIFAFQNQLDSLLEEELVLLRGRDDRSSGVQGRPVYNRLFWNFTSGDGEVAYAQAYNVSDANSDGFINEFDARILFSQGHGDAWGHYLTGITTYYDLLRHSNFEWVPRTESVLVAGTAVPVDFLDERKFASLAAAKAKAGAEIVDLTYRLRYVEDPAGQWQGYKDTDTDRAWGVTEWARRANQGAYFDWVAANAILPAADPDTNHVGIQKIDRTTVLELAEIATHANNMQSQLDRADVGLNPLGVAKGSVPFDIDPSLIDAGQTHFEQVYDRAVKAMNNAILIWNQANKLSEQLRRNQDTVEQFTETVGDQERDFKNRVIEIYGYPYAGDIGPGKTYPSGYDGPDLYHYMYAHTTDIIGTVAPAQEVLNGFFTPFQEGLEKFGFVFEEDQVVLPGNPISPNDVLQVQYPLTTGDYAMVAPAAWGERRAPGEIQFAMSELLQAQGRLRQALESHANLVLKIEDQAELIQARFDLAATVVQIKNEEEKTITTLHELIKKAKTGAKILSIAAKVTGRIADIISDGLPKVVGTANDVSFAGRLSVKSAAAAIQQGSETAAGALDKAAKELEPLVKKAEKRATARIATETAKVEAKQKLLELEQLIRQEAEARFELATLAEVVKQNLGRYQSAVAKGDRLLQERIAFRKRASAQTQEYRYSDMGFRIFRNDALQKYRAQFDLAARYVYLAAAAYDYESNLLGSDAGAGREFLTDIVRQRTLGQVIGGVPIAGTRGLADPLGRLQQNFSVLKPQLGFNNPQTETDRFSLRSELLRLRPAGQIPTSSDEQWRAELKLRRVDNLWTVPEFRRFCRPFAPESAGPQPGLVIRFPTTITFGRNFFDWPLGGGDSAYDPTLFSTKVRSVGVWFSDYNNQGLSQTPRVYLVPAGSDVLRSPTFDTFETREWRVVDQRLPIPFPVGFSALDNPAWIPMNDSLSGTFNEIRRFSSFRAYHDAGLFDPAQATTDSRLIGRSVWNTDWMLIIPGGTFLFDPNEGLDTFINSVTDIKIFFQTYAYSGN